MSFLNSQEESEVLNSIKNAGAVLLEYWPGKSSSGRKIDIETKSDGSFVTTADYKSNEIIINTLSKLFPDDGILSEEIPFNRDLLNHQRIWVLDPLDGTKSYIQGNDDFSILLSLTINGDAKVGFIYFPARDQICLAKERNGTTINGISTEVSSAKEVRPESIYYRNFEPVNKELFYPKWMDSGCALVNLSSGNFDGIILKLTSHREWDLAAPTIAIEESGGQVSDENGNKIKFNKGSMGCNYYVASNKLCHKQLLDLIKEIK